jgi:hypothetical protein
MSQHDLMTEIAEIITDMRRIEYDANDPMRHCKGEAKRLAAKILVSRIDYEQRCNEKEAKL